MSGFRRGVRLGIDVGKARVGVARCDPDGMLAVPVETVPRSDASIDRIAALCAEWEPMELVVGLPVNMHGDDTPSTVDAREFAAALGERMLLPVRLVDERLSTVSAHAALRSSGRSQKKSRNIVDQVAAVVLLQQAIDTEKSTGRPYGALIEFSRGVPLTMPDPGRQNPQDDLQRSNDLFDALPTPSAQIPEPDRSPAQTGSRRAAREARAQQRAREAQQAREAQDAEEEARARAAVPLAPLDPDMPAPQYARSGSVPIVAAARPAETPSAPVSAPLDDDPDDQADEQDHLQALFAPEAHHVPKKKRGRGCLIGLLVVLIIFGGIAAAGAWVYNSYKPQIDDVMGWGPPKDYEPGKATGEAMVTIRDGDTGEPISKALYAAGVTKTPEVFYDLLVDENLVVTFYPGVYKLEQKMTAQAALDSLNNEDNRLEDTAMVPEGGTIAGFLPTVADSLEIPLKDLQAAVKKPADYGVKAQSLEGWLFPAVYTYDPGATAKDVIKKMVERTRQSLSDADVPSGDEERVLTIASIIQREGRAAEFDKVSRVIQNRLVDGMKLQMDSTAQYGAGELEAGKVSTSEDAQHADNPWNTYVHKGLPATPIATASDAAIDAAMHPAEGPWLYFVTINPESGETVFSKTYEEHQQAIQKWDDWCQANGNPSNGCSGG